MQSGKSIANPPLLIGLVLSLALHVAALRGKGLPDSAPAKPIAQQGRTVVQLTLLPSIASKGSTGDIDVAPTPPEEQTIQPALPAEPIPKPPPEQPQQPPKPQLPPPSPEQDASLIQEKGVTSEAQTTKSISPTYPRLSRHRSEEGSVVLSVEVLADGRTGKISITQPSGYRRLDEAALKAARKTTFTPAKQLGQAIGSTTELSFTFRLTDD